MAVIIDGFNLIYKFPELEEFMYMNLLDKARKGLLDILKEYNSIKKEQIFTVFDGKKNISDNTKKETCGPIEVSYSLDLSADFLIKNFIKKSQNPKMVTVVTSDKDIIIFARRFKAKVFTSEEFSKTILSIINDYKTSQIQEKETDPDVTDDEITYWEKKFNS